MRHLALIPLICCLCLAASVVAEEQRQLDPTKPADAVLIIDGLTRQMQLPRDQAVALTMSIQTLGGLVRELAEAKAKAAEPKPVEPAKPKD